MPDLVKVMPDLEAARAALAADPCARTGDFGIVVLAGNDAVHGEAAERPGDRRLQAAGSKGAAFRFNYSVHQAHVCGVLARLLRRNFQQLSNMGLLSPHGGGPRIWRRTLRGAHTSCGGRGIDGARQTASCEWAGGPGQTAVQVGVCAWLMTHWL